MSRNMFENNDAVPDEDDIKAVGNGPHFMLPPLAEGHEYVLADLPSGRKAVVVQKSDLEDVSEVYAPRRDEFGRKFTR